MFCHVSATVTSRAWYYIQGRNCRSYTLCSIDNGTTVCCALVFVHDLLSSPAVALSTDYLCVGSAFVPSF